MFTNLLDPFALQGLGSYSSPTNTEEAQDKYSILIG